MKYSDLIKQQEDLAKKVITKNSFKTIRAICGVDVSYKNNLAYTSAVIFDRKKLEQIELKVTKTVIKHAYVPGLLFLREEKPMMTTLKLLKNDFDLLLVDGNGQLHPRRCGLACHIGLILDKPTIGVAKSFLCGKINNSFVELDGKVIGKIIENKPNKKIYVSIGHKINLRTATTIVRQLIKENEWLPEPLRLADYYSKKQKTLNSH
jgi:deoxyribonuclease V